MQLFEFFLPCAKGVHGLLLDELKQYQVEIKRESGSGIVIMADVKTAMKICLWSRVANRVLYYIDTVDASSNQAMYKQANAITWDWYMKPNDTLLIQAHGQNKALRNSHYAALRSKEAVCDFFMTKFGERPNIDKNDPNAQLHLFIRGTKADIYFDFAGQSLHKRGYRQAKSKAPLKETLAASLLSRAGWQDLAKSNYHFIDPLCGSGTLVLEAAMMACDIAPNLLRKRFGFHGWKQFDESIWKSLIQEAEQRKTAGLANYQGILKGTDKYMPTLKDAMHSAEILGLQDKIEWLRQPLNEFEYLDGPGLVLSNPPYGERMGNDKSLRALYQTFSELLKNKPQDWQLAVFTADRNFAKAQPMKAKKHYSFYNGRLHSQLYCYE